MLVGSIYALINPAFPDKLKLGRTTRTANHRACELSKRTAVPDPFIVLYEEFVIDCEQAANELHARFAEQRVRDSKEFFRVSPKEAILAREDLPYRPTSNVPECRSSTAFGDLLGSVPRSAKKYASELVVQAAYSGVAFIIE